MLLTEYNEQAHINSEKELSYEEGREEGKRLGKAGAILELLEELGSISGEVHEKIMNEAEPETLTRWHKLAAKAESIEQFLKGM